MIISHQHRFIFIKTLKTAGTSIEVFLSQVCDPLDVVTPIFPGVKPHLPRNYEGFYNHIPAYEIRSKLASNVWLTYFKFCVERNPWDKVLSYFHMKRHWQENATLSFDTFLESGDLPLNYPLYTELEDRSRVIVDEVIYYEHLSQGLGRVFRQLGIAFNGSLGVAAKSEYRTDRRPYREVYTKTQAERVAKAFHMEVSLHGYRF